MFSLLVNANSKLRSAGQKSNDALIGAYAAAVKATVGAIFHVPEQVQDPAPSLVPPGPSLSSANYPVIAAPGPSTKPRGSGGVLQGEYSMRLDPQDGDIIIIEEVHPSLDVNFEEPGYSSEEDDKPDTINGLTFPEMRTVLQRVSDGRISDRERAEAAMLMLGMAGGVLLSVFNAFHSLLMPSTRPQTSAGSLFVDRRSYLGRTLTIRPREDKRLVTYFAVYNCGLHPCGQQRKRCPRNTPVFLSSRLPCCICFLPVDVHYPNLISVKR